jgi:hypothetical protein
MIGERIVKDEIYKNYRIIVRELEGGMNIFSMPGYWYCGYVVIPKDSKFYGVDYRDIEDKFDVHGGLTFSGEIDGIDGYLLGFDCAHAEDNPYEQDEEYTLKMCKKLVNQIEVAE